ncbi:MAG TPA: hypothetical protein VFA31_04515 [Candidatus Polarisedimenticolia bacterium]|nr:hypothetical protein [Candidatus Polarisedimenticolia bacterium]
MNEARAVATLSLFVIGILSGVVLHAFVDKGPGENPYPALPKVDEPRAAHDVVAAIAADDAQSLSRLIDAQMLSDLDAALQPITDVRGTKFLGAVDSEGRLLSAYVVTGKTTEGIDFVVGFVLRVANDQVVGVN